MTALAGDPPAPSPLHLVLSSVLAMLASQAPPAAHTLEHLSKALESVDLHGAAALASSMGEVISASPAPSPNTLQILALAQSDLTRHLQAWLDSEKPSVMELFDVYRSLEKLCGREQVHPTDLCSPAPEEQLLEQLALLDLPEEIVSPGEQISSLSAAALHAHLDKHVLAWVKTGEMGHAQALSEICLQLARGCADQEQDSLRRAWQLAAAWLEALGAGLLPVDVYAKRLVARLRLQLSHQLKGQSQPQSQTLRELLFFCDQARRNPRQDSLPALLTAVCVSAQLMPEPEPEPTTEPEPEPETQLEPESEAESESEQAPEPEEESSAIVEIQPTANLGAGAAAVPQVSADTLKLGEAIALLRQLQEAFSAPELEIAVQQAVIPAATMTRHAWEAGWTNISTLSDRLHRICQRVAAALEGLEQLEELEQDLHKPLRHDLREACSEMERLLRQLEQGFMRRIRPEIVECLEDWLTRLPAPEEDDKNDKNDEVKEDDELEQKPTEKSSASELEKSEAPIDPMHFAVLEQEFRAQWPLLQAAQRQWMRSPKSAAPPVLLRALHTLKGSARLAAANDWAAQAHALETLALEEGANPEAINEPLHALHLAFSALQQEMDLRHPQRSQPSTQGQPLEKLQRHSQSLLSSHSSAVQNQQNSQNAIGEMSESLQRLRQLIQDSNVWAHNLMMHSSIDPEDFEEMSQEWYAEISELLRSLLDATDDLGTVQNQLQHYHEQTQNAYLKHSQHLRGLQHSLIYVSQQSFGDIEPRLKECLRLAAQDTGKEARLEMRGAQLRLKKNALQALAPALEHLVRNSMAHGIETPEQRQAAGKSAQGQLVLEAMQQGRHQVVVLQDDGAGLDVRAIGERARALGLYGGDDDPSPEQAAELILKQGFSTADQLTELAGRGIGMDAVVAQVRKLGGKLEIQSASGKGCTFTITLPSPPQMMQIVSVRAGNWRVALPSISVQSQRRLPLEEVKADLERGLLRADAGGPLPLYWAGALWQQSRSSAEQALDGQMPVLLLRSDTQRWAVSVDEVLPSQEVVLQPGSGAISGLSAIPGLLGTAVQPNGQVVQVYDPSAVIAAHEKRQKHAPQSSQFSQSQVDDDEAAEEGQRPLPLVLVVDDSISVRRLAQHMLTQNGWGVQTAANGLEALKALEEHIDKALPMPSLLLVDIEMPQMNGLELLRRLRQDERWRELPVVMLTAHEAGPVSQQALDMGAQAYLTKPYTPEQLLAQVRRYAL